MRFASLALKGVVITSAIAVLAAAGAPRSSMPTESATTMHRAEAILTSFGKRVEACTLNCEFDCSSSLDHVLHTNAGGNDGGEQHSCAWSVNGCKDHSCRVEFAMQVQELEGLLPTLTGQELHALEARHAPISVNGARNAVQIKGCGGLIVVSKNLTAGQAHGYGLGQQ